jgi:sarcosine oxidase, subunit gamma
VTAREITPVGVAQVDVRVSDPSALPFDAPGPNATTTWSGRDVLWLGPDEWLVVGDGRTDGTLVEELERALADHHRSVVDVSAGRTVLDLADALTSLSSGCGLDLDPSRWRPGMCAQTLFGQAQVILQQRDERTTRVFVRPSFAGYLLDRFRSASVT